MSQIVYSGLSFYFTSNSVEDLGSLCIVLTELSTFKIMKAKSQNVCTVLYFNFHFHNDA